MLQIHLISRLVSCITSNDYMKQKVHPRFRGCFYRVFCFFDCAHCFAISHANLRARCGVLKTGNIILLFCWMLYTVW